MASTSRRGRIDGALASALRLGAGWEVAAELGARMGKRAQGALVSLDRVQGRLMVGEVERVTFGMFSLMRDESPQLDEPERIDGADADGDEDVSLGI